MHNSEQLHENAKSSQLRMRKHLILGVGLLMIVGAVLFASLVFVFIRMLKQEEIHDAARRGDLAQISHILDEDPNRIESRNRLQLTPLLVAAWRGQPEAVELLIQRGADANAKWDLPKTDDGQWNALHIAANNDRVDVCKILIRAGTEINHRSLQGETPLDVAKRNSPGELADLLRAHGAVVGGKP